MSVSATLRRIDVVSGKWKLIILALLLDRTWRFKELTREIGITPRILSKELQELELNQLITRTVLNTRPLAVEYAATEHAQTLAGVLSAMREWGDLHRETIVGKPQRVIPEMV